MEGVQEMLRGDTIRNNGTSVRFVIFLLFKLADQAPENTNGLFWSAVNTCFWEWR